MTTVHAADRPDAAEARDPYCLSDEAADRLLADAPWSRYAVLGDSVAEGLGDPLPGYRDLSWADRLAAWLRRQRPGLTYLNLGLRNLTAAEVRRRQLRPALDFRPDLAALSAGGNDMLGRRFDPDAVEAELDAMVGELRRTGCEVITFGYLDISRSAHVPEGFRVAMRERLLEVSERARRVSLRYGGLHVDLTEHPAKHVEICSRDGLHANRRGHAIVAAETARRLGRRLAGPSMTHHPEGTPDRIRERTPS